MKKEILFMIVSLFSIKTMAQIEVFKENAKKAEEPTIQVYDSLRNMSPQKYGKHLHTFHHLIGQTLMYCGAPYFFWRNNENKEGFKTGSYYKVIGVLPDSHNMELEDISTGEHKEEKYKPYDQYKYNYKWVVVGHYEKIKSLYLNKEFVYVKTEGYDWREEDHLINLETDTVTKSIPEKSIWTCIGVQVKPRKSGDAMDFDKRSPIILIFNNEKYGKHYCYLEDRDGDLYTPSFDGSKPLICGKFQLKSYYDEVTALNAAAKAKKRANLTKKFGASNAKLIMEGFVRIGMTKEMCEEAWGKPDEINRSIGSWGTHEQWVYGNSYLYFEGNKLTATQD